MSAFSLPPTTYTLTTLTIDWTRGWWDLTGEGLSGRVPSADRGTAYLEISADLEPGGYLVGPLLRVEDGVSVYAVGAGG